MYNPQLGWLGLLTEPPGGDVKWGVGPMSKLRGGVTESGEFGVASLRAWAVVSLMTVFLYFLLV